MGYSVREQTIFAELEAVFGTAETLVAADAILVQDLQFDPARSLRMLERDVINSSLNPRKAIYGGALLGFQFTVELKGSGSAGTAPQALGDLLQACGLDETVVASTSVTYTPSSTIDSHGGVTIGLRQGNNYRQASGCRGSVSFSWTTGEFVKATFNMIGHIESEAEAVAPTPSFESGTPPPFLDAAFTVAAAEFPINQLTLDLSNTMSIAPDPNQTDGFGDIRITARATGGSFDPEDQDISTKDWVNIFRQGTSQAIATGTIGSAGNQIALSVPLAYFRNVQFADREELVVTNIEYRGEDTDGTDDFSLQFT